MEFELTPARRAAINSRLAVLRPRRQDLIAEQNDINRRRDRLKGARDRITRHLGHHGEFRSSVRNALEPIDRMRLRGNNRSQMTDRLREMRDRLVADRDWHQSNRDAIRNRINALADQRTRVGQSLTAVTNEIEDLERELRVG